MPIAYTGAEYDEAPVAHEADARPYGNSPRQQDHQTWPTALENPKEAVKLRLDHDVLAAYRKTGSGWRTRINADL